MTALFLPSHRPQRRQASTSSDSLLIASSFEEGFKVVSGISLMLAICFGSGPRFALKI
jgi:hypothetical protein